MSKRHIIPFIIFFLVLAISYSLLLTNTLRFMEGADFFVMTPAFFMQKLAEPPGITSWLNNFLLQFFSTPVLGAIIEAFLLALAGVLCGLLPWARGKKGIPELGLLFPLVMVLIVSLSIDIYLQAVFFFAFLLVGLRLRNTWTKSVYLILFAIISFFFISWPLMILAILTIAIDANIKKRNWIVAIAALVAIAISIADIYVSNNLLGFIPFDKRFWYSPTLIINANVFYGMFFAAVLLMFLPALPGKKWLQWLPTGICIIAIAAGFIYLFNRNPIRFTERFYTLATLTEQKEWDKLLDFVNPGEVYENNLVRCYALLAEAGRGTLPENLFNYPVETSESFLLRHKMQKTGCIFNRQFYDNLGIYDEAFRQAFEYGVMTPEGYCFNSMRQMVHYAILSGDLPVAEKYMGILSRSNYNGKWLKEETKLLEQARKKQANTRPLIQDTYVSVYPMNSELIRQLERFPKNKKMLDYLLCGLLLERKLDQFAIIMRGFPIYKDESKLPRPYAEAVAMVSTNEKLDLRKEFPYDLKTDDEFKQFYSTLKHAKSPAELSSYLNSFWYYFFATQPRQSSDGTTGASPQKPVN